MLVVVHVLRHRDVAFLAAAVAFHEDAGDDKEEDEGKRDGETDENDEADGEVMSCVLR